MKQSRLHLLLLVSALSLLAIPACGDPEDPSQNDTTPNNTTPDDGCGAGRVRAAYMGGSQMCYASCTDDASCGAATSECKAADGANAPMICVPKMTAPETCGEGEVRTTYLGGAAACYKTCTDDASCTGENEVCRAGDAGAGMICVAGMVDTGPCMPASNWGGQTSGNRVGDGGELVANKDAYPEDAGIAAVNTFIDDNSATIIALPREQSLFAVPEEQELLVEGAVVTATSWGLGNDLRRLTLEDKNEALVVYFEGDVPTTDKDGGPFDVTVGTRMSFKVTGVKIFSGSPQIATIEDIVLDNSDKGVHPSDVVGTEIDARAYHAKLIRFWGKVLSFDGECGSIQGAGNIAKCFTVAHADDDTKTETIRVASDFVDAMSVGECWTFIGPLSAFPPLYDREGNDPEAQMTVENRGWLRTPFREQ